MEFFATCPVSFEQALARELRDLGAARVRPLTGRVTFEGTVADVLRVCLWTRLASRVLVVIGRVDATGEDALYRDCRALPWEDVVRPGATIAIAASGSNRALANSHFAALKVKDALCDRLVERTGTRPDVDTAHPDARIQLAIRPDKATLALDLAGEPLFKRLHRKVVARLARTKEQMLRPDYAALVLVESGWRPDGDGTGSLIDIACADAGMVLEAASLLAGRAPGANRVRWGFQGWKQFDPSIWRDLARDAAARADARAAALASHRAGLPRIIACGDDASRDAAAAVLEAAGLAGQVTFTEADSARAAAALRGSAPLGAITLNALGLAPSRLASALTLADEVLRLPQAQDVRIAALSEDELPARVLDAGCAARLPIKPDNEDAWLLVLSPSAPGDALRGEGAPATPGEDECAGAGSPHGGIARRRGSVDIGSGKPVPLLLEESAQFAHRLIKVARQRRRWAKRAGVSCYRVYDADLPDYSCAIDLYEGAEATPGRWLVIAEYAAPRSIDATLARLRMLDVLAIVPRVLEVDPGHAYARVRTRSRGGSQYGKGTAQGKSSGEGPRIKIAEDGLTFLVNFDDHLDTGIFLDHRVTRHLLREEAAWADSFLNLFAYTGTATCYAAAGGAKRTTTVDMSNTYLDWARRNMAENGFSGRDHEFIRADVISWVREQRHGRRRWDLIFCDPPTFSNSTKMGRRTFDVQRDHVDLLAGIARLLTPGGRAVFSCNLRTFKPDIEALRRAGVAIEDVTEMTIPEDFARNKRIHKCYVVERA